MIMCNKLKTIIVLGMHRSATSLIAKGIHDCGVFIGDDLLPESGANPWGYYEDRSIVHLNDRILYDAGGSWSNPPKEEAILAQAPKFNQQIVDTLRYMEGGTNPDYSLCGFKDPRLTLTIKLYLPFIKNPHFILCLREPLEVARSLAQRDGMDILAGIALAKEYNRRLLCFMAEFV